MKMFNKILTKILKPHDSEVEYHEKYGFSSNEIKEYLHIRFCNALFYIYDRIPLLHWFLCLLCDIEMQLQPFIYKGLKRALNCPDVIIEKYGKTTVQLEVPEDTFYCEDCIYCDRSKLARFLFGSQSCGYCHYLGRGDYSFYNPTLILWDGCKECGINEDINDD